MPTATVAATAADREVIPSIPPAGWEHIVPRYRVVRDVKPAEKRRFASEPPFSTMADSDRWQYGTEVLSAGQTIECTHWPHPSFRPLNFSAKKTLEFFNTGIKSRMPRSPWQSGRLLLQDGVTTQGPPPRIESPRPEPFDLKPVA